MYPLMGIKRLYLGQSRERGGGGSRVTESKCGTWEGEYIYRTYSIAHVEPLTARPAQANAEPALYFRLSPHVPPSPRSCHPPTHSCPDGLWLLQLPRLPFKPPCTRFNRNLIASAYPFCDSTSFLYVLIIIAQNSRCGKKSISIFL